MNFLLYIDTFVLCLANNPYVIESHREREEGSKYNNRKFENQIHTFTYGRSYDLKYARQEFIPVPPKYRYSSTKNDLLQSMQELNSGHLLCGLKPIYPHDLLG